LSEWCNEVESCKKNKVKSKHSKTDIHLVATIKAYVEYINKEIGEYFKPYWIFVYKMLKENKLQINSKSDYWFICNLQIFYASPSSHIIKGFLN
jgi:uncharacterized protein involved in high-affinity Fe2+ transport